MRRGVIPVAARRGRLPHGWHAGTRHALRTAADGLAGVATRTVDLRYQSQGYELNVPWDEQSPQAALEAFRARNPQSPLLVDADKKLAKQRMKDFKQRMDAEPRKPPRAAGHDAPPGHR